LAKRRHRFAPARSLLFPDRGAGGLAEERPPETPDDEDGLSAAAPKPLTRAAFVEPINRFRVQLAVGNSRPVHDVTLEWAGGFRERRAPPSDYGRANSLNELRRTLPGATKRENVLSR